jgi:hypothetical protein
VAQLETANARGWQKLTILAPRDVLHGQQRQRGAPRASLQAMCG